MPKQVLNEDQVKAIRRRLFWYGIGFNRHWRKPCEELRAWLGTFETVEYDELLRQVHRIFAHPRRQKRALNLDGSFVKIMLDMLHEVVGPLADEEHTRRDATTVAGLKALEGNKTIDGGPVSMTGGFLGKHMENVVAKHVAKMPLEETRGGSRKACESKDPMPYHDIYHSVVTERKADACEAAS